MAEGFARAYGSDVLEVASAGVAPAFTIPFSTVKVMEEKNIRLAGQFPKSLDGLGREEYDLIVNMSGYPFPAGPRGEVEEWEILDPIGMDVDVYREVRDEIENRVMRVILAARGELRGNCEVPPADRRKFLR
jgi:protein-tyrosine-phosphatase